MAPSRRRKPPQPPAGFSRVRDAFGEVLEYNRDGKSFAWWVQIRESFKSNQLYVRYDVQQRLVEMVQQVNGKSLHVLNTRSAEVKELCLTFHGRCGSVRWSTNQALSCDDAAEGLCRLLAQS